MPGPNRMIRRRMPHHPNNNIGVRPTIQQKILNTGKNAFGIDLSSQQGAAFNVFDTVLLKTGTARQTISFFNQTGNKSANFTNMPQNTLQAGESLGIQYMDFALITLSAADLTSDETGITAINPIYSNVPLVMATASLILANGTMFKDFLLLESHPIFNPDSCGIANLDTTAGVTQAIWGVSRIRLDANPVIPPNMQFRLDLSFGPITITGNVALLASLGRTGSIFSPKAPN